MHVMIADLVDWSIAAWIGPASILLQKHDRYDHEYESRSSDYNQHDTVPLLLAFCTALLTQLLVRLRVNRILRRQAEIALLVLLSSSRLGIGGTTRRVHRVRTLAWQAECSLRQLLPLCCCQLG